MSQASHELVPGSNASRTLRALCVLSNILGNRQYSEAMRDALDHCEFLEARYVTVGAEDYSRPGSALARSLGSVFEAEAMVRRAVRAARVSSFDVVVANGWEMLTGLRRVIGRRPAIVACDMTPRLADRAGADLEQSLLRRTARRPLRLVHHVRFRRAALSLTNFLPATDWCASSLVRDYDVDPAHIRTLCCPLPLGLWRPPAQRTPGDRLRLLFVGNDFERKGGRFLLELFAEHLSNFCSLMIVSNDPALPQIPFPDGVTLIRGRSRDELIPLYQAADVFVLPTRREAIGYVFGEAAAVGLPIVATDVGGVHYLVRHDFNGKLMRPGASADDWAFVIRRLWEDADERQRLGRGGRALAVELLDVDHFRWTIRSLLQTYIAGPHRSPPGNS